MSEIRGVPVHALLKAAAFIVVAALLILCTYGEFVSGWWRWGILAAFAAIIVVLVFVDRTVSPSRDVVPIDHWTIAHGFAGIVLGVWYVPLLLVVLLTVAWEIFEKKVPPFGDKEILFNRFVDVGIALVLWAVAADWFMIHYDKPFPLLPSFHWPSL